VNEVLKRQNGAVVKDRGREEKLLSRHQRTRLLKGKFTREESDLLRPYPKNWWVPLIFDAVEAAGLNKDSITAKLERFLSHEEKVKKVVGMQLSSVNPAISLDRTRKPGPERIENMMAALS